MEHILKNIKRKRTQLGYSHEYVAHELDISQVSYSKLEKNETKLSVERLFKIADILETKVEELLEVNSNNIYHQNNNDTGTFIGHQEVQNLYEDNKEKTQIIIALYEERLKDKDELIAVLRNR
jgi:transcriptional regulator with XRE-family HTH domain